MDVPKPKDEIAALAKTMNTLLGRLQRGLIRQRSFVADAGHELLTPFAVLELAGRPGRTRAELEAAIERAPFETERLSHPAEDLLFLALSNEGGAPMERGLRCATCSFARWTSRNIARATWG